MNSSLSSDHWDPYWQKRLSRLIARNKKAEALRMLDKIIDNSLPLFRGDPKILEERHLAWLFKVDLLRSWRRLSEALAWICLECELYPDNITARALKDQLKDELGLLPESKDQKIGNQNKYEKLEKEYWQGIAGMRELKSMFERDVILPLQHPDLYKKFKVPMPNGVLLYGPPGCGKTLFAKKAAQSLGYSYLEIKTSDVASIYIHGTQQLIAQTFAEALSKKPCAIFIDEMDAFVPNRGAGDVSHSYRSEVNEFLTHLNNCAENRILIIGATNMIKNIDPAVLRPGRMDKKIFVGPPDYEARVEALKMFMDERPQHRIDYIQLAEYTDLFTFAELEHVVNEAARQAVGERRRILMEDLIDTVTRNPAAHTQEQIEGMRNQIL